MIIFKLTILRNVYNWELRCKILNSTFTTFKILRFIQRILLRQECEVMAILVLLQISDWSELTAHCCGVKGQKSKTNWFWGGPNIVRMKKYWDIDIKHQASDMSSNCGSNISNDELEHSYSKEAQQWYLNKRCHSITIISWQIYAMHKKDICSLKVIKSVEVFLKL